MQYLLVDEGTCTESTVHEVKTQKIHVQPFQVITVRERTRCYHNGNTALMQGERGVAIMVTCSFAHSYQSTWNGCKQAPAVLFTQQAFCTIMNTTKI